MVPARGVELQHDGLGRIGGINVALHADLAVRRDFILGAVGKEVLSHARGGAFERCGAAEDGAFVLGHKLRWFACHIGFHACGESVFKPHQLAALHRGRRVHGGGVRVLDGLNGGADFRFCGSDLLVQLRELPLLLLGAQAQDGRSEEDVSIHGGICSAVEEGVEGVKLLLRDGVKLVVVAHGAAGGQAHPHRHGGFRAVHGIAKDELLIDAATLAGRHVAAVEAGGDLLVHRGIGQQVSRQLPDGELVIGQVLIEGAHHPVAVGPHAALVVQVQAVGVGVAGCIQPVAAHVLAVAFGLQQAGHDFFIRIRAVVRQKGVDLRKRRRQARQIQRHTADERLLGGLGLRRQFFLRQPCLDEGVDRIADHAALHHRRRCFDRRFKAPVLLVFRALFDPALQYLHLRGSHVLVGLRRGHHFIFVLGQDTLDDGADLRIAGLDGKGAVDGLEGALGHIQAQISLALLGVKAVAGKAVVAEDRPDVAVEVELRRRRGGGGQEGGCDEGAVKHGLGVRRPERRAFRLQRPKK